MAKETGSLHSEWNTIAPSIPVLAPGSVDMLPACAWNSGELISSVWAIYTTPLKT